MMDSKVLFAGILRGKDKEHHVVDKCASVKNNRKTDYTCPTKSNNNNISISCNQIYSMVNYQTCSDVRCKEILSNPDSVSIT